MKRVLLTGMSGTGKSTLICTLAARGYKAIDTDTDQWTEWVPVTGDPSGSTAEPDWVWREDRIQRLLSTEDVDVLFVSGCTSNQVKFYAQFGHIVLLSAPARLLMERLAARTTNPYGQHPDELVRVLRHLHAVEPLLRRVASLEVDTSAPVELVIASILGLVRPGETVLAVKKRALFELAGGTDAADRKIAVWWPAPRPGAAASAPRRNERR